MWFVKCHITRLLQEFSHTKYVLKPNSLWKFNDSQYDVCSVVNGISHRKMETERSLKCCQKINGPIYYHGFVFDFFVKLELNSFYLPMCSRFAKTRKKTHTHTQISNTVHLYTSVNIISRFCHLSFLKSIHSKQKYVEIILFIPKISLKRSKNNSVNNSTCVPCIHKCRL